MAKIHNFQEAHDALRTFYGAQHPMMNTLGRMQALLAYLGDPQNSLRVIHIAGTSGKTSTAYYAAALLQAAGHTVGLTVSPHVDEVNERVQVGLVPLQAEEFFAALEEMLGLVEQSGITPSYFEFMTALAFYQFKKQAVDYAVVEVGLGGRYDATNTIARADKVCVITDIGLDHTEILGDTVELIAAEKVQIIHRGNEVFMHQQADSVMAVATAQCNAQQATMHVVHELADAPSLPLFQRRNLELARTAVAYVLARDRQAPLTADQLGVAARTYIPARMEIVTIGNDKLVIDGAHNEQKISTLLQSIRAQFGPQPVAALVGFTGSPAHWQPALDILLAQTASLIFTSFHSEKDVPKVAVDPALLAAYSTAHRHMNCMVEPDPAKAYRRLMADTTVRLKLVVGSFYLLNDIRPLALG